MKVRTDVSAGGCLLPSYNGTVIQVQGNGYYAAVRGQDGSKRYVNKAYTTFYPNDQPLTLGEPVMFNLHPDGFPNAGKISCISPAIAPEANG